MKENCIVTTGRRKTAVARVRLFPGDGAIEVNTLSLETYFPREILRTAVMRPLALTDKLKTVRISGRVDGGGKTAQAEALAHGISRALLVVDETLRGVLKKEGLLTRDSRMKERKKYGQKGARKKFQFSKR